MTQERLAPSGRVDRLVLRERGLDLVLADCLGVPDPLIVTAVSRGPGDATGVVLYPKPSSKKVPEHLGYVPAYQTWRPEGELAPRPGVPLRYVGWITDEPPEPEDLERASRVSGYTVMVGHPGRGWHVPIARARDGRPGTLPADWRFEKGKPVRRIKQQYLQLFELAGKAHDAFNGSAETRGQIKDEELALLAVEALAVNYRLGPEEIDALAYLGRPLLDDDSLLQIMLALIDKQFLALAAAAFEADDQKKTTPESSSGTPGDEASLPVER